MAELSHPNGFGLKGMWVEHLVLTSDVSNVWACMKHPACYNTECKVAWSHVRSGDL